MSMEGWWIVHTVVLPVLTMLRTVRMTMATALASRPAMCQRCQALVANRLGKLHLLINSMYMTIAPVPLHMLRSGAGALGSQLTRSV